MSTARIRNTQADLDTINHRPPADEIPANMADLINELVAIDSRIGEATTEMIKLKSAWGPLMEDARLLDARASAQSARDGVPTQDTPHADALNARLTQATADIDALTSGRVLIVNDIQNARSDADRAVYAKRATTAHAALDKAAQTFRDALDKAARADALCDWIAGRGYDPSTTVDARALSPEAAASLYTPAPCNVHDVIATIAALTKETSNV